MATTQTGGATTIQKVDRAEFEALDREGLLQRYLRGVERFDPRIFDLDDARLDMAFLPDAGVGLWPIRVLLGHLADAELVLTFRMRRIIAEDRPVLALWDENAFVDSGIYGEVLRPPVAGFVATIHTLRRWTVELLCELSDEQWKRVALHPERGELTLRDIIVGTTWHLEHHNAFLQAKVDRLLGPRPAEEPGGGGCCGSSCGCKH